MWSLYFKNQFTEQSLKKLNNYNNKSSWNIFHGMSVEYFSMGHPALLYMNSVIIYEYINSIIDSIRYMNDFIIIKKCINY